MNSSSKPERNSLKNIVEYFVRLKSSPETRRGYRRDVLQFFDSINLLEGKLEDLRSFPYSEMCEHIQTFLSSFKRVNEHTGYVENPTSANRKMYALSSFFKHLVEKFDYPKNPVSALPYLPVNERSNTPTLTKKEVIAFFGYMKRNHLKSKRHFRDYLMVMALFYLALRRKEAVSLRWNQIEPETQSLRIIQKGGTEKTLPFPDGYWNYLEKFKSIYGQSSDYIFHPIKNNRTKNTDKPLSADYLFKVVKNVAKVVLPERTVSPHSFRASFVTLALEEGDDLISIANATGHSSVEMVKYYDTRNKLKSNAINSLGKWI